MAAMTIRRALLQSVPTPSYAAISNLRNLWKGSGGQDGFLRDWCGLRAGIRCGLHGPSQSQSMVSPVCRGMPRTLLLPKQRARPYQALSARHETRWTEVYLCHHGQAV